jgi:membrane-associated PAP2 superfamily phosphatase
VGRRPELKSIEFVVVPRLVVDLLSLLCEIVGEVVYLFAARPSWVTVGRCDTAGSAAAGEVTFGLFFCYKWCGRPRRIVGVLCQA